MPALLYREECVYVRGYVHRLRREFFSGCGSRFGFHRHRARHDAYRADIFKSIHRRVGKFTYASAGSPATASADARA